MSSESISAERDRDYVADETPKDGWSSNTHSVNPPIHPIFDGQQFESDQRSQKEVAVSASPISALVRCDLQSLGGDEYQDLISTTARRIPANTPDPRTHPLNQPPRLSQNHQSPDQAHNHIDRLLPRSKRPRNLILQSKRRVPFVLVCQGMSVRTGRKETFGGDGHGQQRGRV